MTRRRSSVLAAPAAVAATAATVAGVTVLSGDGTSSSTQPEVAAPAPAGSGKEAVPTDEASPAAGASPATGTRTVSVYYVGETSRGPRLYREFHRVQAGPDVLYAAISEALSTTPDDSDYRTDWPEATAADVGFDGAGADGEVSLVLRNDSTDLRVRPAGMTPEQAELAVQQLVYTAQAAIQTRAPVQFYLERQGSTDRRTDTILGIPVSEPLAEGDASGVLAQVWVVDPAEGAELSAPFEVSGLAAAFEAQVEWRLIQGDRVVKAGFTTAEECCTMAPYSFDVTVPAGDYTLVVSDTDPSGGEGFAPWQDTKRITIRP